MKLSPETLTVLRGEEARFTCSTSNTQWTVMGWLLNGRPVLTISKEFGVLPSINPNVTAETSPVSRGDSWVFVLKNTERRNQGQVTCELQGIERKTARLFVQGLYVHMWAYVSVWDGLRGGTVCMCLSMHVCVTLIHWSKELFISAAKNFKGFLCTQLLSGILTFLQTRVCKHTLHTHTQSTEGNEADGKSQLQPLQCERVQEHTEFNLDEAKSSV